jgi:hypothetical protein
MAILTDLQFTNQAIHLWTGTGPLLFNGTTYLGVGTLGKVSTITETQTLMAQGVSVELSGIDSQSLDIQEVMQSMSLKNTATLSIVLFDESMNVISGTPIASYQGFMDQATIDESGSTSTVSIALESKLAQLNRSINWTYAAPDCNFWNPAEGAFQWCVYMVDYVFRFGN